MGGTITETLIHQRSTLKRESITAARIPINAPPKIVRIMARRNADTANGYKRDVMKFITGTLGRR